MSNLGSAAARGDDGRLRCPWALSAPEYVSYHDGEWGRPVRDGRGLFERLSLEAFQSGLSWLTILRKREGFRAAFDDFRPEAVAGYGVADRDRLLADPRIVRNRAKIDATIANAAVVAALGEEAFAALIWSFAPEPVPPAPESTVDLRASTPESIALARALKKRGVRFVGPTTAHALMQACGLVDDHLRTCAYRQDHRDGARAGRDLG